MIVDRYPPKRLFRLAPDLPQTFAPELAQLDRLLEDDAIFCRIKADMAVKAGLRRAAARTVDGLHAALGPAFDAITAQDAQGFFRHAGYACPN
jgi:hypothetical protein